MHSSHPHGFDAVTVRRLLWTPVLLLALFVLYKISVAVLFQNPVRNLDALEGSQKAHLVLAKEVQEDLVTPKVWDFTRLLYQICPRRSDGVAQPLYPWSVVVFSDLQELTRAAILAKVESRIEPRAQTSLSDQDRLIYNQGRWLNLIGSVFGLLVLGLGLLKRFGGLIAIQTVLLCGLGALLPRSAYFQAEVFFYLFFLWSWILCASLFYHNALWKYVLLGAVSGLAYLAKDEVYVLLFAFVIISTARCVSDRFFSKHRNFQRYSLSHWRGRNHLIGLVALAVMHFMVIGPRLVHSYETRGSFFHAYPRYWAWLDATSDPKNGENLKTVQGWMREYAKPSVWENEGQHQPKVTPNAVDYWKTHQPEQIHERWLNGTKKVLHEFLWPTWTPLPERGKVAWRYLLDFRGMVLAYLGGMLAVALLVRFRHRKHFTEAGVPWFRIGWSWIFAFSCACACLYVLYYGWYYPVMRGERFFLALFMPVVVTLLTSAEAMVRPISQKSGGGLGVGFYKALKIILLVGIVWRLAELLRYPNFNLS